MGLIFRTFKLNRGRSSCPFLKKAIGRPMMKKLPKELSNTLNPLRFNKFRQFFEKFNGLSENERLEISKVAFYLYNNNFSLINLYASELNRSGNYKKAFYLLESLPRKYWDFKIFCTAVTSLNGLERYRETFDLLKFLPKELWDDRIRNAAAIAYDRLNKANTTL